MDWDKEFSNLEFDSDRKNDYEFDHKYFITTQTELAFRTDIKWIIFLHHSKKFLLIILLKVAYLNNGKTIVYSKTIIINKPIIRKSEFADWNNFVKDINKFYNDQVV